MLESLTSLKVIGALTPIDVAIVTVALVLLMAIAWLKGREQQSTRDYFLGNRRIPWGVVCLSFVATEVSAVTIVSVPATGFGENMQYLQFYVGSAAAKLFVAFLFIPAFYKHDCTTIYQFLRERFGPGTQYAGASFFFVTRLLASGSASTRPAWGST